MQRQQPERDGRIKPARPARLSPPPDTACRPAVSPRGLREQRANGRSGQVEGNRGQLLPARARREVGGVKVNMALRNDRQRCAGQRHHSTNWRSARSPPAGWHGTDAPDDVSYRKCQNDHVGEQCRTKFNPGQGLFQPTQARSTPTLFPAAAMTGERGIHLPVDLGRQIPLGFQHADRLAGERGLFGQVDFLQAVIGWVLLSTRRAISGRRGGYRRSTFAKAEHPYFSAAPADRRASRRRTCRIPPPRRSPSPSADCSYKASCLPTAWRCWRAACSPQYRRGRWRGRCRPRNRQRNGRQPFALKKASMKRSPCHCQMRRRASSSSVASGLDEKKWMLPTSIQETSSYWFLRNPASSAGEILARTASISA